MAAMLLFDTAQNTIHMKSLRKIFYIKSLY
jgi:hypothetical protein